MPNTVWASDRLVYRAVEVDDEPFLKDLDSNETDYMQISTWLPAPRSTKAIAGGAQWLRTALLGVMICLPASDQAAHDTSEKPKPQPIGWLALNAVAPEAQHHRHTSVAIFVGSKHQGKGYGGEAICWALEWAFVHANMHRVEIAASGHNTGAIKLYERLGFVPEGRRRQRTWLRGGWVDRVEFGMLEEEWRERYGGKE